MLKLKVLVDKLYIFSAGKFGLIFRKMSINMKMPQYDSLPQVSLHLNSASELRVSGLVSFPYLERNF